MRTILIVLGLLISSISISLAQDSIQSHGYLDSLVNPFKAVYTDFITKANDSDQYCYMVIMPFINKGMGVPEKIVDSIYGKNPFPIIDFNKKYWLCVFTTSSIGSFAKNWNSAYYYQGPERMIIIASALNVEIQTQKHINWLDIKRTNESIEIPDREKMTWYLLEHGLVTEMKHRLIMKQNSSDDK
jgi:hypothetical protein